MVPIEVPLVVPLEVPLFLDSSCVRLLGILFCSFHHNSTLLKMCQFIDDAMVIFCT